MIPAQSGNPAKFAAESGTSSTEGSATTGRPAPGAPAADPIAIARRVLAIEADAVSALAGRLDARFVQAVEAIEACRGRVVVSGIGKSGHVARKIAATLASTGTPAFFLHAAEASHGDLGMITADDVLVALSYSGESAELNEVVPLVKRRRAKLVVMSGNAASTLARHADVFLDARVEKEACPLNLAPTASTTAMLALGDALAVVLLERRGFSADDFALSHPGGTLGRRLLTHVSDVMRSGDALPIVGADAALTAGILEMSKKGLGMTAVCAPDGRIAGILTDGDLRRALERGVDVRAARVADVMTRDPRTIGADRLAVEAVEMMESRKIGQLLVVDTSGRLVGALNTHDLFRAKVI